MELLIDHLGIACYDLSQSVTLYQQLGFQVTQEKILDEGRNLQYIFLHNGSYCIELVAVADKGKKSDIDNILESSKLIGNKIYHVCFVSQNLEYDINRYKQLGYKLVKEPSPAVACQNRRVAFLIHFDLGLIELLESESRPNKEY